MRVSNWILFLILMLAAAPAWAGGLKTSVEYQYYAIDGRTPLQVVASMLQQGPRVNRRHAYATTQTKIENGLGFNGGGNCEAPDLTLQAKFLVTLPKHRSPGSLPASTRTQYNRLMKVILDHENEHVRLHKACVQKMYSRISRLQKPRSCNEFMWQAKAIVKEEWARCEQQDEALDSRDADRHDRLPLIAEALKEVDQAKARAASNTTQSRSSRSSASAFAPTGDPSDLVINVR
ncbi:MAG: DUF922 domain-containing protein [Rhodobiaceae bacterium]|nr:DUF922 domain-containing protein [Rhodobiaceae bacterium]MCC0056331.1 DUF922 domain-containing protein [Rhodobiaceae bacterium]